MLLIGVPISKLVRSLIAPFGLTKPEAALAAQLLSVFAPLTRHPRPRDSPGPTLGGTTAARRR